MYCYMVVVFYGDIMENLVNVVKDLTKKNINGFFVIKRMDDHISKSGTIDAVWKCRCSCGRELEIKGAYLRSGKITHCGCKSVSLGKRQQTNMVSHQHGHSRTRLYQIYSGMKYKCKNPKCPNYKLYGGMGINICDEWLLYPKKFLDWAENNGYTDDMNVRRLDNTKDFSPENCYLTTKNSMNRDISKRIDNKSGYIGISQSSKQNKWLTRITVDSNQIYIGEYFTKKDAVIARNDYIIDHNLVGYLIQEWENESVTGLECLIASSDVLKDCDPEEVESWKDL